MAANTSTRPSLAFPLLLGSLLVVGAFRAWIGETSGDDWERVVDRQESSVPADSRPTSPEGDASRPAEDSGERESHNETGTPATPGRVTAIGSREGRGSGQCYPSNREVKALCALLGRTSERAPCGPYDPGVPLRQSEWAKARHGPHPSRAPPRSPELSAV